MNDQAQNEPAARRPISSRGMFWVKRTAAWLASHDVSPNAISVSSVVFSALGAAALVVTNWTDGLPLRLLWLAVAILVQLRLLANLFDGMVAVEFGKASPVGELFNEVPDRISDALLLIALGFVPGSSPHLGYAAAVLAVFVAYVRAIGSAAGAGQAFSGIMAKPQRMFLLTVLSLFQALSPPRWQELEIPFVGGLPGVVLALILLGALVTSATRILAISRNLRRSS